ncbi:MAG: hypothetical protein ACLFR8_02395 [Alkalispirochaeta sp.]
MVLPEPEETTSIVLGSGEVAVISVPPERIFTSGIALRVLPTETLVPPGVFTLAVYGAVDAPDETGIVTIAGALQDRIPLGTERAIPISVPFVGHDEPAVPPGTRVITGIDPDIGAIGFQIVPATKGMQEELLETRFEIEVEAILRPVGALEIEIIGENDTVAEAREILELAIDGTPIDPELRTELPPGIYRLDATAGDLISHTANVGIERAEITRIVLEAERPKAQVRINVPSVAEVFWNGSRRSERSLTVDPGTHTVLIRIGDFSISRRIELSPNGDYEVGIDLDILLKQN